jgi:hypothetical protein
MPRPRYADRPEEVTLSLPSSLMQLVRQHLNDPLTGRLRKGELSRLVTRLLREHFQQKESSE